MLYLLFLYVLSPSLENTCSLEEYSKNIKDKSIFLLELMQAIINLEGHPRMYIVSSDEIDFNAKLGGKFSHSLLLGMTRVIDNKDNVAKNNLEFKRVIPRELLRPSKGAEFVYNVDLGGFYE